METTSIDFRVLFNSVPGLYLILSPDLSILGLNRAYAQATMTVADDIIGKDLFDVFPDNPEDDDANGVSNLRNSLNHVIATKQQHTMAVQRYDIRRKDGSFETRYWSPINIPVLNADKEIDYIIHRVEDVTDFVIMKEEQKANKAFTDSLLNQIEEMEIYKSGQELQKTNIALANEVLQNERKYKSLIENSHDIISLRDLRGELLYQSPSAERILGWTLPERQSLKEFSFIHPSDKEEFIDTFKQSLENPGQVFYTIHRALHKEGNYVWLEGTIINMLADDVIQALVFNFRDITTKKQIEEKANQSEYLIRSTMDNMSEGLQIIDFDYRYIFVNKAAANQGKLSTQELLGYSMMEKYPGIENSDMFKTIKHCMDNRMSESLENEFTYPDGSKDWFELRVQPVPEGLLVLSMNINKRKQAEMELAANNKKLSTMNKELEQFAYVASHDLQEPLRTLISYTNLFQKEFNGKLEGYGNKYMEFIFDSSKRMQDLVKGLLDYSRIGKEKELDIVDCNKVLEEVIADMAVSIKESQAEIKVGELPIINAYPVEIRQLFQNLLSNALKYRRAHIIPSIVIGAKKEGDNWLFYVKDNGIGIAEGNKDKIFVIFKRLHNRNEYDGTGIGLAHCKKILDFHGGNIWVESKLGKGSTFYFVIPKL